MSEDETDGNLLEETISTLEFSNCMVHPIHFHSFRPVSFFATFMTSCVGCDQRLPSVLLLNSNSAKVVQCAACGIYAHRSCALSFPSNSNTVNSVSTVTSTNNMWDEPHKKCAVNIKTLQKKQQKQLTKATMNQDNKKSNHCEIRENPTKNIQKEQQEKHAPLSASSSLFSSALLDDKQQNSAIIRENTNQQQQTSISLLNAAEETSKIKDNNKNNDSPSSVNFKGIQSMFSSFVPTTRQEKIEQPEKQNTTMQNDVSIDEVITNTTDRDTADETTTTVSIIEANNSFIWTPQGPPTHWASERSLQNIISPKNSSSTNEKQELQDEQNKSDGKYNSDNSNDADIGCHLNGSLRFMHESFANVATTLQNHLIDFADDKHSKLTSFDSNNNDEYQQITATAATTTTSPAATTISIDDILLDDEQQNNQGCDKTSNKGKEQELSEISSSTTQDNQNEDDERIQNRRRRFVSVAGGIAGGVAGLVIAGPLVGSALGLGQAAVFLYQEQKSKQVTDEINAEEKEQESSSSSPSSSPSDTTTKTTTQDNTSNIETDESIQNRRRQLVSVAGGIAVGVAGFAIGGPLVGGAIRLGQVVGMLGTVNLGVLATGIAAGSYTANQKAQKQQRVLKLKGDGNVMLVRPGVQIDPIWNQICQQARLNFEQQQKRHETKGNNLALSNLLFSSNETQSANKQRYGRHEDIVAAAGQDELSTNDTVLLLTSRILNDKSSLPGFVYRYLIQQFRIRWDLLLPTSPSLNSDSNDDNDNTAQQLDQNLNSISYCSDISNDIIQNQKEVTDRNNVVNENNNNENNSSNNDDENIDNNNELNDDETILVRNRRQDAHAIIKHVTATLLECRPELATTSKLTELTATAVESLVFGKIYDSIIDELKQDFQTQDEALNAKWNNTKQEYTQLLQSGTDDNNNNSRNMISNDALISLCHVTEAHSSLDKLQYCVQFLEQISHHYTTTTEKMSSGRGKAIGADSLLKMVCQHMLVANVPHINAEIAFMEEFARDEDLLRGKEGYALVTLQASLHFLNLSQDLINDIFGSDT